MHSRLAAANVSCVDDLLNRINPITIQHQFTGSEKQKAGTEKVLKFLIKNKPAQWNDLQKKYDPEGIYFKKYEAEAKAHGVDDKTIEKLRKTA